MMGEKYWLFNANYRLYVDTNKHNKALIVTRLLLKKTLLFFKKDDMLKKRLIIP